MIFPEDIHRYDIGPFTVDVRPDDSYAHFRVEVTVWDEDSESDLVIPHWVGRPLQERGTDVTAHNTHAAISALASFRDNERELVNTNHPASSTLTSDERLFAEQYSEDFGNAVREAFPCVWPHESAATNV